MLLREYVNAPPVLTIGGAVRESVLIISFRSPEPSQRLEEFPDEDEEERLETIAITARSKFLRHSS
jgi:hypothetical protein